MAEEIQLKKQFALQLLKNPDDIFAAARAIYPGNFARSAHVAQTWPTDDIVVEELIRLRAETDPLEFLPGKADLARKIWDKMNVCSDPDAFAKLGKLYAEVRGYVERPKAGDLNVTVTRNNVMVFKDHGDDSNWEAKLAAQQKKLTTDNATRH